MTSSLSPWLTPSRSILLGIFISLLCTRPGLDLGEQQSLPRHRWSCQCGEQRVCATGFQQGHTSPSRVIRDVGGRSGRIQGEVSDWQGPGKLTPYRVGGRPILPRTCECLTRYSWKWKSICSYLSLGPHSNSYDFNIHLVFQECNYSYHNWGEVRLWHVQSSAKSFHNSDDRIMDDSVPCGTQDARCYHWGKWSNV